MDEGTWNSRYILRQPFIKTIDMHARARSLQGGQSSFTLFHPLTDLQEAKREVEHQQAEEEERKKRLEQDKQRKKQEEKYRREEEKRMKKVEEQRRREEQRLWQQQQRKGAKSGKGGCGKGEYAQD